MGSVPRCLLMFRIHNLWSSTMRNNFMRNTGDMSENMEDLSSKDMSGTLMGHLIPGLFMLLFGLFFCVLTFIRLFRTSSNEEFCLSHIPEHNMMLLRRTSIVLIACTILGILFEGEGNPVFYHHDWKPFFRNAQHQTLYALFCFAGVAGVFESIMWLPPESFRVACAAALLGESVLWHEHTLMKMNPIDQRCHALLVYTSLGAAVLMLISILKPNCLAPYLGSFLFIVWQGLWLLAAAYNTGIQALEMEEVSSIFLLQGLMLACAVMIGTVILYRKADRRMVVGKYARVKVNNNEETERDLSSYNNDDEEEGGELAITVTC